MKKVITTDKKVVSWTLDPFQEIADIDTENNSFPRRPTPSRFQLFKQQQSAPRPKNPMQQERDVRQQSPATQGGRKQ